MQQLDSNLNAISVDIPANLRKKLDQASQLEPAYPYVFFDQVLQARIHGGVKVRKAS